MSLHHFDKKVNFIGNVVITVKGGNDIRFFRLVSSEYEAALLIFGSNMMMNFKS